MAQFSRPTPDNGRVVTDDEYEKLASSYANDGLIGLASDTFPVYADSTGRQVKIRTSKLAQVRGYLWGSDTSSDEIVATTTNTSGFFRIDRLVLQLDRSTRNVRTFLKTGTASASPSAPALTQNTGTSGVWEMPLARWVVASGYTTIAAGDIIPEGWFLSPNGGVAFNSTHQYPFGSAIRPGLLGFEADTLFSYRYNGTKWLRLDDEQLVITDQQWLNTTTFTQLTAANATPQRTGVGLGFAVAASSRYSWELRMHYIGVSSVGLAIRNTFPTGARMDSIVVGYASGGTTFSSAVGNTTTSPYAHGVFGPGNTGGSNVVRLAGTVLTGSTAGSVAFEFAQGTANAGSASWALVGSSLRHRQVS